MPRRRRCLQCADLGRQYGELYARFELLRAGLIQAGIDPARIEDAQSARLDSPLATAFELNPYPFSERPLAPVFNTAEAADAWSRANRRRIF